MRKKEEEEDGGGGGAVTYKIKTLNHFFFFAFRYDINNPE
jgi:hypothetical protein